MPHGSVCLDTNAAIDILNGRPSVVRLVENSLHVLLPVTVVGEFRYGAYRSMKISENLAKIDSLELRCTVVPVNSDIADRYGQLRTVLHDRGVPLPENDIWIAACALCNHSPLISNDIHFNNIPALRIIRF